MSIIVRVEKINIRSYTRKVVEEPVATEAPLNLFINDKYVITLLATPKMQKELALGWLFTEGVLQSLDEIKKIVINQNYIKVLTRRPINEGRLQTVGVTRIMTTACGLSASKFLKTIGEENKQRVKSNYEIEARNIVKMVQELDKSKLYQSTWGVHVAALFEDGKLVAFAEDVGRHNAADKAVGVAIQSRINFSRSVLVSSGRQPADMVLKAAKMGIPIVVSIAGPIRSGIIAAEKTGVTLVCFVRNQEVKVYTHPSRILMNKR
jgi:FdhD protein